MKFIALSTGVRDGDARAPGQLPRILRRYQLPLHSVSARQVHGRTVLRVSRLTRAREVSGVDGFLTETPQQPLVIYTADCVPIFLVADRARVVGLLHAGWRGVQKGILAHAVSQLKQKWNIKAAQVQVWLGPHIRSCCFEVLWDVARHFPATRQRRGTGWTVSLEKEIQAQARRLGLRWTSKRGFRGCTMHEIRFHSYRRDQTSKRQVSVMMKCEES